MVTKCKPCHFSCPVANGGALRGDQEPVRSDKKARHAKGAVSALSTRVPKVTGLKPTAIAAASSVALSPPSGPLKKVKSLCFSEALARGMASRAKDKSS